MVKLKIAKKFGSGDNSYWNTIDMEQPTACSKTNCCILHGLEYSSCGFQYLHLITK